MEASTWRPAACLETLRARARLLARIRGFFSARGVLEVETPLLGEACGSDPNLAPISAHCSLRPGRMYLQTSPEFAMKRLLAAGSGPIYQLGKAFRDGEAGARHNPEFTLLEWYRPGFDPHRLMDEVQALVTATGVDAGFTRRSYRDLFQDHLGIDPHTAPDEQLARLARQRLEVSMPDAGRDDWLDLLYSHLIEPGLDGAVFIFDYPPSQAALARIEADATGQPVARRFELVLDGLEIANGYHELRDAAEQRRRFAADLRLRQARGQPGPPVDERFLAALAQGLPECAGVAVGVDRLLMRLLGARGIQDVLAFPLDRA